MIEPTAPDLMRPFLASARGKVYAETLHQIIPDMSVGVGCSYLLSQTITQIDLSTFPQDIDAASFQEARAFGPGGELRWRRETWREEGRIQEGWRVVFVGSEQACPVELRRPPWVHQILTGYVSFITTVLLWGERRGEGAPWFESRMPRLLHYPLPGRHSQAAVRLIEHQAPGKLPFRQYLDVIEWTGG